MLGNGRAAETFEYIFTLFRLITASATHRQMGLSKPASYRQSLGDGG